MALNPKTAGPFLFFTNIDLVVQAVVNSLFFLGHVMKPVGAIGRILQSAFGFWGGIACTIEFRGLFLVSPGLVQDNDSRSCWQSCAPSCHDLWLTVRRSIPFQSEKFMERADNLPVNWDFQNNFIHTLPLISAFAIWLAFQYEPAAFLDFMGIKFKMN